MGEVEAFFSLSSVSTSEHLDLVKIQRVGDLESGDHHDRQSNEARGVTSSQA